MIYVYEVAPIDNWTGWSDMEYARGKACLEGTLDEVDTLFEIGREAARMHLLWEGDIREGPYVSALPMDISGTFAIMVAWKQDNNGTTFVASQAALPWLESEYNRRVQISPP